MIEELRKLNDVTGETYVIGPDRRMIDGVNVGVWSVLDEKLDWENPIAWAETPREAVLLASRVIIPPTD